MTKLFKKSLALLLTLALCLSAMACCFFVSAEGETTPAGSISFVLANGTTEINPGDDVIIDVVANWSGVAGAEFTVTGIPAEAEVKTTNTEVVINHDAAAATVKFVDGNNGELANGVLFSISFTAGEAATLYNLAFADNSVFCNLNEEDVTVTCVPNSFEVKKVEEPEVPAEPVVDPALKVAGASLGYGTSSLQLNFRIRNTVIALYNKVDLVIIPQTYDRTTYNLVEDPQEFVAPLVKGSTFSTYSYSDMQLYELGLNIDYMLKAYDADGNLVAVSETFTTSPASYLKNLYGTSSDAKLRTVIADTLVVGQASMDAMGASNEGSDLANAASIIEGFDTSEATPSVDTYNTIEEFVSSNADFGTESTYTHQTRYSVTIGKVPYIGFRIKDQNSVLDLEKISYRVTYTAKDLSGNEIPYDQTFTSANSDIARNGRFVTFSFADIGLGDSDKNITIEISYDNSTVCTLTYSVETYLGANTTNATIGNIATALLKLGSSFRAYSAA